MNIEKISIYGYGKWLHQEFDHLTGMQIFLGDNEAGKSTLSSFIHTMFFGFPSARKKDTNSYLPKKGEVYGGKIFLTETRFGTVIVERMKERNRGKATLTYENGEQEVINDLSSYLLGVDAETYELLYTFKIDSLLELNKVKKNDLNRYLLSVGTSGSEKLLQLADDYRKEAQKEFKPTGTKPPLNQKVQDAENLLLKLEEAKQQNSTYENLLLEASSIQEKIEQLTLFQKKLEQENNQLSESIRLNDYYLEWLQLSNRIKEIDTSILPKDARTTWERLQGKITEDVQKQTVFQERIHHLEKQRKEYTHVGWFKEHQKKLSALQHDIPTITALYNRQEFIKQSKERLQNELGEFKQSLGMSEEDTIPVLDERIREEAITLLNHTKQIENKKQLIQEKLNTCEAQLSALEQKVQESKGNLIREDLFQQWKKIAEKPQNEMSKSLPSNSTKVLLLLAGFLVIIVGLVGVFMPSILLFALFFSTLLLAAVRIRMTQKRNKIRTTSLQNSSEDTEEFSMQSYIQQATLRERFDEWVREEESQQNQLITFLDEQEQIEIQLEAEREKQEEWLYRNCYPSQFSLEQILTDGFAVEWNKKTALLVDYRKELEDIEERLLEWEESSQFVKKHFELDYISGKEFLNQFSEIYQSVVLEESMSRNVQDKQTEVKRDLDDVQRNLKENQLKRKEILDQAHVETEPEFYQLLHAKEEQTNQKRRRDFLQEQLEGKEEILEKYPEKEPAEQLFQNNQETLQNMQKELKQLQKKEVSVRHEIGLLEKGGTYSSLLQDYAMIETEMREMIVDWGKKVIAAEWIEGTLREGRNDRLPLIIDDMNTYFSLLTQHTYKQVVFQKSNLKIQHSDGTVFKPHELSQGTIEQLYIAMRFAFIKNTADIATLPILIDDGFVNFDTERKQAMYSLMQELSKTVQIFFFTFDQNVQETFATNEVYMLH